MSREPASPALSELSVHSYPDFIAQGRMGPYRLHEVLGEGGMGIVFRATHAQSGHAIALKTVNRLTRRRMLALREEIIALRAVEHPGLVRLLDQGTHEGIPWYAMDLLTGKTLAHYNDQLWDSGLEVTRSGVSLLVQPAGLAESAGPASSVVRPVAPQAAVAGGALDAALRLYCRLCEPLGHIHARGMVHRDLKPHNVFIRSGDSPVLMDFGLIGYASGAIGREVLEAGNQGFGTVHYVSPERIEGRQVDARADLYSLGCMLYETLLGRPPFVGEAEYVVAQHLSAAPIPPSQILDGVPRPVERLILQLLAKTPQARIGHARDVAAVLGDVLREARVPSLGSDAVPLFRPQLSGREDVLAGLSETLDRARERQGGMVLIGGESGIGKTFLTSELAHAAVKRGFRVITGGAMQFSPERDAHRDDAVGPFQALHSVLQSIADSCRESSPEERQRILGRRAVYLAPFESSLESFVDFDAATHPDTLPGAANVERIKSALSETLHAYASTGPVLIIIDDVQWADKLSTSFLAGLERSFFDDLPLVIVCAYRTEHAQVAVDALRASEACTGFVLDKLGAAAVQRMVADMLSSEPPLELVTFLVQESEGNPFFVAEYLRYLVAGKHIERADGQWVLSRERGGNATDYAEIRMPGRLEELLTWRLQALSLSAQAVLQAAAVLGRTFNLEVLAQLSGVPEERLLELLGEARERLVLESLAFNSYRFRHDKLREATYVSLAADVRRGLHARAARAIEAASPRDASPSRARELALHYDLGGEPRNALGHFVQAGEGALEQGALHEAIEQFRSALRIGKLVGGVEAAEEARWQRMLGAALHDVGDYPEGSRHLERALALLGERSPRERRTPLGVLIAAEVLEQARNRLVRRTGQLDAAASKNTLQRAKIHDRIQQAAYYTDDSLPMLYSCMRMLNLAERVEPSPTLTVAYANAQAVAGVLPARGLAAAYVALARRNMEAAPSSVAGAHFCLIAAGYATGVADWPRAFAALEEGLEACLRIDFAQRIREMYAATSSAHFLKANYAEARRAAACLHAQAMGKDAHTHCWALLLEAQVRLVEGHLQSSLDSLRLTQPLLRTLGRPERIWSRSLEAFVCAKLGDASAAERASDQALADIEGAPLMHYYTMDAVARCAEVRLWLCTLGAGPGASEREKAARRALRALQAMKRSFPIAEPRLHLLQGLRERTRGKHKRAERHFQACVAAAKRLVMPYEEARALLAQSATNPASKTAGDALIAKLGAAEQPAMLL